MLILRARAEGRPRRIYSPLRARAAAVRRPGVGARRWPFCAPLPHLAKTDLLSLDDWGPDRFTASQRRDLMEIIEDHYGAGSTLITSQLPVEWCLTCTGLGVLP
jgi:hypothetical protein